MGCFFDIPMHKGGKFLNNLWCCVFQIGTHNPRGINERFSFNRFILIFSSRRAKARTSAFEFFYGGKFTLSTQLRILNYPFSIFLLVPGKIYSVVRQLEIFLLFSRSGTLQEKYFGFPQSLTHFVG